MSEAPYPPAEPPADGDRTNQVPPPGAPRYSASASVPNPPNPPAYGNPPAPGAFGQPPAFGQGAPQFGQPPASGSARASASVSNTSPFGQPPSPTFGAPPQGYPAQSNVYGQGGAGQGPGGGNVYGAGPAGGNPGFPDAPTSAMGQQGSGVAYGSPAPGGAPYGGNTYGPGQTQQFGGGQQYGGQQYGGNQGFGGSTYGPPAGGQGGQGGQPTAPGGFQGGGQGGFQGGGQGGFQGGGQPYGQAPAPEPNRGQRDSMTPTGGWPYVEGQPQAPKKSRRGVTIAVIAVAILVVVGVGGYVGLKLATSSNQFVTGACVKENTDKSATVVDCSTSGAYRITKVVDNEGDCGDATQPSVVLTDNKGTKYACLAPA